jgi:hypothetical protein
VLDIDHCLPWAAWPCGDLWNLLPAHRRVNQHLKRDRLPSTTALQRAREGVLPWWESAYVSGDNPALSRRFADEARASPPALAPSGDAAVALQRLRLHQDQQVPGLPPGYSYMRSPSWAWLALGPHRTVPET